MPLSVVSVRLEGDKRTSGRKNYMRGGILSVKISYLAKIQLSTILFIKRPEPQIKQQQKV